MIYGIFLLVILLIVVLAKAKDDNYDFENTGTCYKQGLYICGNCSHRNCKGYKVSKALEELTKKEKIKDV